MKQSKLYQLVTKVRDGSACCDNPGDLELAQAAFVELYQIAHFVTWVLNPDYPEKLVKRQEWTDLVRNLFATRERAAKLVEILGLQQRDELIAHVRELKRRSAEKKEKRNAIPNSEIGMLGNQYVTHEDCELIELEPALVKHKVKPEELE